MNSATTNIGDKIRTAQISRQMALIALKEEKTIRVKARCHLQNALTARDFIQQVIQKIQEQAHSQISYIVSTCLHTVFGEDSYDFEIRFNRKRGKTEAQMVFLKDGHEVLSPTEEDSGGVLDVAAFALRLACLVLSQPQLHLVLVLDEPFRFVSVEYRPAIRTMLEKLAKDFKVQFIIVTHQEEYITGKVVRL